MKHLATEHIAAIDALIARWCARDLECAAANDWREAAKELATLRDTFTTAYICEGCHVDARTTRDIPSGWHQLGTSAVSKRRRRLASWCQTCVADGTIHRSHVRPREPTKPETSKL